MINTKSTLIKLSDITMFSKGEQINGDLLLEDGQYEYLNGGINPSGKWNSYNVEGNTITISEGGNSSGYVNYMSNNFWCGAHCYYLYNTLCDRKYLYYSLKSQQSRLMGIRSGACMPNIKKNDLANFTLKFHEDNKVQQKIAGIFTELDTCISVKEAQLNYLTLIIKSRFIEMFGDSDFPTTELINLIQKGKGLSYGIVVPGDNVDTGVPMIRPSDFKNGSIDLSNLYKVSPDIEVKYKKTRLMGNELLVQVIGQPGQVMLATPECFNMNVTRNLAVICPEEKTINRIYLKEFIEQEESQRTLIKNTKQSTLKQLPLNLLKKLQIKVPPIAIQNQFADFVAQVDKSKLAVQQSLNELETLKKSLMQQYFG